LPYTWWDHQTVNAQWYQKNNGDTRIVQNDWLYDELYAYMNDNIWYKKQSKFPKLDELCQASKAVREKLLD
jgi:hypothetical protein